MKDENFSLRFRLLMSYHDLTLSDIALHTRHAISTVGTWKNGRVPASADSRRRLAELFGVSEAYLLCGRPPQCAGGEGAARALGEVERAVEQPERPPAAQKGRNGRGGAPRRRRIEAHLRAYLDAVEALGDSDLLAHAWVQLRREFPLEPVLAALRVEKFHVGERSGGSGSGEACGDQG
jgi:transcriptional regulator with XRE-family HTH domain